MELLEKSLESFGFTSKEVEVYTALLECGDASYTELSRATGIRRTSLYSLVAPLRARGVVTYAVDTKKLTALPPDTLFATLQERLLGFHRLIPQLKDLAKKDRVISRVRFYRGAEGVQRAYTEEEEKLPPAKERLSYVVSDMPTWTAFWEKYNPEGLAAYLRQRERLHYKTRALWSGDMQEPYENKTGSSKSYDIQGKILPSEYRQEFDMEIRPNYIIIADLVSDEPYAIKIISAELSAALCTFFEFVWSIYNPATTRATGA